MSKRMKYYMRGIGVGIIVCALILIVSRLNRPAEISDSEVVSRALALGMIDPGNLSLSQAAASSEGQVTEIDNPAGIKVIVDDKEIASEPASDGIPSSDTGSADNPPNDPSQDQADTSEVNPEENSGENTKEGTGEKPEEKNEEKPEDQTQDKEEQPEVTPEPSNDQEKVVLEVYRGNSSDVVASRAQAVGLVEDAADFDRYLVKNGYANRISVGSFTIEKGSDYNTIARIITNSQ